MTAEEELVQVDAYLDTLLAGRFGQPRSLTAADDIDGDLEATAGRVQRALARFHPSFAFEERLAARLAAIAAGHGEPQPAAFPEPVPLAVRIIPSPAEERRARPGLLRNGAIASGVAGVSIAGAALLVRRRTRPSGRMTTSQPVEAGL